MSGFNGNASGKIYQWGDDHNTATKPLQNHDERLSESGDIVIGRKTFRAELSKNDRGAFIRVIEKSGGHRDSIVIPLDDGGVAAVVLCGQIQDMVKQAAAK